MPHEALPFSDEEEAKLTSFERAVIGQVALRGNQNAPLTDRYSPKVEQDFNTARVFHRDGRVGYGNLWQVHRLDVGPNELTYAHLPKTLHTPDPLSSFLAGMRGDRGSTEHTVYPSETELLITEFDDEGARARTSFYETGGIIEKRRVSRFAENFAGGVVELVAPLGPRKTETLIKVITSPEANMVALEGLISLTVRERQQTERSHREYDREEREHREHLEALSRLTVPRRNYA